MIGLTLGNYQILENLGSGGMGEVYRARDKLLRRDVAIKILSSSLQIGTEARHRLLHEARSASALNHPNICAIYEVGETADRNFIVMELVEGRSLSECIPPKGLPVKLVLRYGTQIAQGLGHAHDRGVVHRDIKPSNIVITSTGQLKILDFGLAKVNRTSEVDAETLSVDSAAPGASVVGTLPYIAPEILQGAEADARSDIWSFGVVLYEMMTGRRPFQGRTSYELASAILRATPEPVSTALPAALRHIIERCLERERGHRYQRSGEIAAALEAAGSESAVAINTSTEPTISRRRRAAWAIGSLVAVLIVALLILNFHDLRAALVRRKPQSHIRSLAVLPLDNLSRNPENEYFADGMTDALITDLAKARQFDVISRTSVMQYKAAKKSLPSIAQELGVDAVVEGSVLEWGDRVRISARLIEARTDKPLWEESYERDLRDILALQDDVARAIAMAIRGNVSRIGTVPKRQVDPDAYRLYLKGMYYWDKRTGESLQKATEYLDQAIDRDPGFALAQSALSGSYLMLSGYSLVSTREILPKAEAAALKALELDDSLSDAHESLATVRMTEWNFPDAEKQFRQALSLDPGNAGVHQGYGIFLARTGRFDESLAQLRKATQLDPLWLMHGVQLGNVYYYQGRYDDAIQEYNKVLGINSHFWPAHGYRAFVYEKQKRFEEADTELRKVLAEFPHTNARAALGELYALQGKKAEARRILRELQENSRTQYVSPYWLATVYVALEDKKTALRHLESAFAEHSVWLLDLKVDPRFEALRSDPRFQNLITRIGFP